MTQSVADLASRRCKPCEGGVAPLDATQTKAFLKGTPGWSLREGAIEREYNFKNHYQTMAFVNAVAWLSHREDHHPEMVVGYNRCTVRYWTHAISGLSENDFICAAKVDALFDL